MNVANLTTFFAAMSRAGNVDEWLGEKMAALREQGAQRRDQNSDAKRGVALREMRERGEQVRDIARADAHGLHAGPRVDSAGRGHPSLRRGAMSRRRVEVGPPAAGLCRWRGTARRPTRVRAVPSQTSAPAAGPAAG